MRNYKMIVSDIVKLIRKSTKLSQEEFSKVVEIHRSSINMFEIGMRIPLPKNAKKYLVISDKNNLGFTLEDFYPD